MREPANEDEEAEINNEWATAINEAATIAERRGTLPADLKKMIGASTASPLSWKDLLRDAVSQAAKDAYDWKRPSRRYSAEFLPSRRSERFSLAVAFDTSGSVYSAAFLNVFVKHLNDLKAELAAEIIVIECDSRIQKITGIGLYDEVNLPELHGGGGTNFQPPFEQLPDIWQDYIESEPSCLIYFTDGYGRFPMAETIPTIWVGVCKFQPPFGQFIEITV